MEQSANKERQIVQWKVNTVSWRVEEFLEAHPEYKKPDNDSGFAIWPAIFTIADQLGLDENIMHTLFDEQPECKTTDLVFVLYLIRLYGRQVLEEFFNYTDTIKLGEVHGFIKGHEGLLQNIDVSVEKSEDAETVATDTAEKEAADANNKSAEVLSQKDLKECLKTLIDLIQQRSETQKEYETMVGRLIEKVEKQEVASEQSINTEAAVMVSRPNAEGASLWKRIIKIEKENAVLKTQLESEKREAVLKHDAAIEMKNVEISHLKKQMDIYISDLEAMRQENESLRVKAQSIRYEQIQTKQGFLHHKKRKKNNIVPLDERQELALKIISSSEYPDFLKEFIREAYQQGVDIKCMQTFEDPKLEHKNFEMMKKILFGDR